MSCGPRGSIRTSALIVFCAMVPVWAAEFGDMERLDPRLDSLVPAEARLERIADGFTWVEGPAWNRREEFLVFSDIPRNSVFRWKEGEGVSLFLKPSGYTGAEPFPGREPGSNGLTWDAAGRLVLCEHGDRRIARQNGDGTKTTLVDRYQDKRINSPNDAVFKSNGDLYFTDPPFGLPGTFSDPGRELDFCGVYRLAADGEVTLLTREIGAPNGIAFSPDEKILYVTNVKDGKQAWHAFDVRADGTLANGRIFHDAVEYCRKWRGGPDGVEVDQHGNLFAAGPEAVYVIAPDGVLLGRIVTGVPTSNCEWGEDGSTLFITADTAVFRIVLATRGARL